jgi:hypothetical protein
VKRVVVLDKAEAAPLTPRVSALSSAADPEPHAGDASARPYRGTLTVVPSLLSHRRNAGPSGSAALGNLFISRMGRDRGRGRFHRLVIWACSRPERDRRPW